MNIKPVDRRIQNLFQDSFYVVPRFQRPYSWTREQLEEFWDDVVVADETDYFIGSMVVFPDSSRETYLNVVDGQQRLTTITLLLASLRNAFEKEGAGGRARGVQRIIERPDLDDKNRFTLNSETPYPYLQEHIQKFGPPEVQIDLGDEEQKLKTAFEFFEEKVQEAVQAIRIDSTIPEHQKNARVYKVLEKIRDQILKLIVIVINLADEDDAYLIFETLNSRGMDLGVSDLVKNHLTRLLKPSNKGVDTAKDRFLGILHLFDESAARINVNTFIHHSWLSRQEYVSQKKLFKAIKQKVRTRKDANRYLDDLVSDSKAYRTVLEPEYRKWTKEEQSLLESIEAILLFGVVQSRPLALAVLRAYEKQVVKLRFAKRALRQLEDYHFIFTAIAAKRAGGGFAKMYAADARLMSSCQDAEGASSKWRKIALKLREKLPPIDEFTIGFSQLAYLNTATKDRKLVHYILARITSHLHSRTFQELDNWTIEHLVPQNPLAGNPSLDEAAVGSIGNLILVPADLNQKLDNKPFAAKKAILAEYSNYSLEPEIAKASKWNRRAIENRTQRLARLAYREVWGV